MPETRPAATGEPPKKVQKVDKPAYTLNVNNAMDKADETKTFKEMIALPPSALQGLAESADAKLAKLHIKTIKDLGEWKFYRIAKAIAALAATEEQGKRNPAGNENINHALDKVWETKSLNEILDAPVSALSGLAEWVDEELANDIHPHVRSIKDLAKWKYCRWAESLITFAEFENPDHSSR